MVDVHLPTTDGIRRALRYTNPKWMVILLQQLKLTLPLSRPPGSPR